MATSGLLERRRSCAEAGARAKPGPRLALRVAISGVKFSVDVPLPGRKARRHAVGLQDQGDGPHAPVPTSGDARVEELRRRLQQRPELLRQLELGGQVADDAFLLRWLKAKRWHVDAVEACLVAHAEWRAANFPAGRVLESEIEEELAAEKACLQGCDSQGRPVVVVLAQRHITNSRRLPQLERLICYVLDAAARAARPPNDMGSLVCLFDLSGLSLRNLDVRGLRAIFELLARHYPESLSELLFVNAPLLFWGAWRVVGPLIEPATRRKIAFVSGAGAAARLACVPPAVLPARYGGRADLVPVQRAVAAAAAAGGADAGAARKRGESGGECGGGWLARLRRAVGNGVRRVGGGLPHAWQRASAALQGRLHPQLARAKSGLVRAKSGLAQYRPIALSRMPSGEVLQVMAVRLQSTLLRGNLLQQVARALTDSGRPGRWLLARGGAWVFSVVSALLVAQRALTWTAGGAL